MFWVFWRCDFRSDAWDRVILSVAYAAVSAKFWGYGGDLVALSSTLGHLIAEASPYDNAWGVGLAGDDPRIDDPRQWRGANVLGWALMELRERLPGGDGTVGVIWTRQGDWAERFGNGIVCKPDAIREADYRAGRSLKGGAGRY